MVCTLHKQKTNKSANAKNQIKNSGKKCRIHCLQMKII